MAEGQAQALLLALPIIRGHHAAQMAGSWLDAQGVDLNCPGALYAPFFLVSHLCLRATNRITCEHEARVMYSIAFNQFIIVISLAKRLLSVRGRQFC